MFYLVIFFVIAFVVASLKISLAVKTEISEYELGFVMKGHKLIDVLDEGTYNFLFGKTIKRVDLTQPFHSELNLNMLLQFPEISNILDIVDVADNELGIEYKDNVYRRVLEPGRYAYWNKFDEYKYVKYDLNEIEVPAELSKNVLLRKSLSSHVNKIAVFADSIGLLFVDGEFVRKLKPGSYFFWRTSSIVEVRQVDLRAQMIEVSGQEILTKDKAAIRVNYDVQYKVVDIEKALVDTKDYARQMYTSIQLALREYIGTLLLDSILARKEEVAPYVSKSTKSRMTEMGVEILSSGLRDVILPGDVKEILNQVLIAEKKAQANNIMRREETASTRSLLNTAKLMEQNEMLFKLKEMEYVEKIAGKVGEITVSGGDKILSQLSQMFVNGKN